MKSFFTLLTRLSLRFRAITLALMVILSVLGVIAVTQLKQELLPSIALPQTIILSQVSGMTSDQVLCHHRPQQLRRKSAEASAENPDHAGWSLASGTQHPT